jgi:hypothetical protein
LPAPFERGDFALVPFASVRAVIEVKRTCQKGRMDKFQTQLKQLQKRVPNRTQVLGLVIEHPEPLFTAPVEPDWLKKGNWRVLPAMTRLFSRSYKDVDVNGVFALSIFSHRSADKATWLSGNSAVEQIGPERRLRVL